MVAEQLVMADLGLFILLVVFAICLIVGFGVVISTRKSQDYRKLITDLYVSGKSKLLAKEDGIDLDNEFKEFTKWRKKQRVSNPEMDLDKAIELELKERVSEDNANKLIKDKK